MRRIAKLIAFMLVTAALYPANLAGAWALSRDPGRADAWKARMQRRWVRLVARILSVRMEVRGTPPQAPFVLVCNHLSYMDVVVLGAHLDCVFVARGDVAGWPVLGRLCRSVDTLFIDRSRRADTARVVARLHEILERGRGVIFFPEATSGDGSRILPFHSSLLEVAVRAGLPVSYAALTYNVPADPQAARLKVCWWDDDVSFVRHLMGLLKLRRIDARITFGPEPVVAENRKALARRLQDEVTAIFEPVPS